MSSYDIARVATVLLVAIAPSVAAQSEASTLALAARRLQVLAAYPDAIVLVRSRADEMTINSSGIRQAATFAYYTGLPNALGAVLAFDGRRKEMWLFVPDPGALPGGFAKAFRAPYGYVAIGSETARRTGIDHVVSWRELDGYLARRLAEDTALVLRGPFGTIAPGEALPPSIAAGQNEAAMWQHALRARFPRARFAGAPLATTPRFVKDPGEIAILRRVAESSATALRAGIASLSPGRRQREAEVDVLAACVRSGADGVSFWPWVMTGPNSPLMQSVQSLGDANFLDRRMRAGELARVDVGCAREGYEGDVGRTAPVSGTFDAGQREAWDLMIAGYRAGLATIRPGRAVAEVLAAFRGEIERRQASLRTPFGRRTAEVALSPDGLREVQLHGVGIESAEALPDTLRAGHVLAFEPMLTVDGVGLYLEDMILVTETGAEVLTKGLPYTATEIERAVRRKPR